ncbi:MAG TPA: DNA-processing protein DprA, partial [Candidatus Polarisedimenticolaceae bacterium]|nr:DNA-processing protein DprA [Candidatus Polarisedimenticolaceae bacterium]
MDRTPTIDWIALNLMPGLGPVSAHRAVARYGHPATVAYHLPLDRLFDGLRLGAEERERLRQARPRLRRQAERELRLAERSGVRVVGHGDPDYPAALAELADAPLVLYLRGALAPGVTRVAVVGSRTPTAYGRRVAIGLAAQLAVRGIEVVSGGARGIDCLAHRSVLDEGHRTVAVLGSGLLRPYPDENVGLYDEVAAAGAVLSEFPLHYPPRADNFPRRNRIISGLSAAVIVVEAAERSGALITARAALEQGREVLAIPGPIDSHKSVGCNRLIQQGAKLVQGVDDVLDELSPMYRSAVGRSPAE